LAPFPGGSRFRLAKPRLRRGGFLRLIITKYNAHLTVLTRLRGCEGSVRGRWCARGAQRTQQHAVEERGNPPRAVSARGALALHATHSRWHLLPFILEFVQWLRYKLERACKRVVAVGLPSSCTREGASAAHRSAFTPSEEGVFGLRGETQAAATAPNTRNKLKGLC